MKRTPEQCMSIGTKLAFFLTQNPGYRLGQMISYSLPDGKDLFYLEDEELLRLIEEHLNWCKSK